jgi:hypothetical protein
MTPGRNSWFAERRLDWIDDQLLGGLRIRREDMARYFAITPQCAGNDLARFTRLYPEALWYDRTYRVFLAAATFYESRRGSTDERRQAWSTWLPELAPAARVTTRRPRQRLRRSRRRQPGDERW